MRRRRRCRRPSLMAALLRSSRLLQEPSGRNLFLCPFYLWLSRRRCLDAERNEKAEERSSERAKEKSKKGTLGSLSALLFFFFKVLISEIFCLRSRPLSVLSSLFALRVTPH